MSQPTWLITGASSGLGLVLCLRVLKAGHKVVGSVRSKTKSSGAVAQIEQDGGSVIELDMMESKESITKKVQAVGDIDFLVNNAGYSILAACEDITDKEAATQMQTNFFGPLYAIQAALPGMRTRKSGTIVNVSSVAAQDPLASCALYSASKCALEGMSEALAREVAPLGITVLIVEPGAFRTDFINGAAAMSHEAANVDPQYDETAGGMIKKFMTMHGKQLGDPVKGMERLFEALTGEGMAGGLKGQVLRLVLGSDAMTRTRRNKAQFLKELDMQEETAKSTDIIE